MEFFGYYAYAFLAFLVATYITQREYEGAGDGVFAVFVWLLTFFFTPIIILAYIIGKKK